MRARPSQIKFKMKKMQFSKLYCTQNKYILKIMKEVFVCSIYRGYGGYRSRRGWGSQSTEGPWGPRWSKWPGWSYLDLGHFDGLRSTFLYIFVYYTVMMGSEDHTWPIYEQIFYIYIYIVVVVGLFTNVFYMCDVYLYEMCVRCQSKM